jgi:hypothetical protein
VPRVALVVLLAGLLAGSALAAQGDPVERHTAADMARARAVVLRAADLGAAWKQQKPTGGDRQLQCTGFRVDESDLVETGEADSQVFSLATVVVSSSASVYRTAAMAATSWRRAVRPGLAACLAQDAEHSLSAPNLKLTRRSAARVPYANVATQTAAYHLVFDATDGTTVVPLHADVVYIRGGRTLTGVVAVSFVSRFPAATLRRLAVLTGRRMR